MSQSARTSTELATCDPVWDSIRTEALDIAGREPVLAGFLHAALLNHKRLEHALSSIWPRNWKATAFPRCC